MFSHDSHDNKAERKDTKTAQKDNSDDMIDKSTMKREQSNQITQASSEDQHNYEVQYLQAKEEIKQLQHKVDSLEDEKSNLLTCCESLQKDLEEIKRENEKVKVSVEDQGVQTDFPISSHEESAAASAEASNSGTVRDSHFGTQQHETQEKPECREGNSNTQTYSLRLRELRQRVARLLVIVVPTLDLQQMNYDCEVIDEILTEVINEISPTETAST
ncbi:hypothetical protein PHYPO_G00203280 [Pangasianodon hypophthalmus]|uniref:Uncharacterized protein n=1 Tax=Pangasianodon hypophthalmus TaxID=310915 RepID=A0A5N5PBC5_PANHP|nr:hypothetical protein PHYPO_G00203280 [Pangasianodon hypophthalmus]